MSTAILALYHHWGERLPPGRELRLEGEQGEEWLSLADRTPLRYGYRPQHGFWATITVLGPEFTITIKHGEISGTDFYPLADPDSIQRLEQLLVQARLLLPEPTHE